MSVERNWATSLMAVESVSGLAPTLARSALTSSCTLVTIGSTVPLEGGCVGAVVGAVVGLVVGLAVGVAVGLGVGAVVLDPPSTSSS
ncbi:hypothetical protein D3C72_2068350 [compost metagenome]